MHRTSASIPLSLATLIAALTTGCQSQPPSGSLAELKREQEKRLFSACVSEHRVLMRGSSNVDYSLMRVAVVKDCRAAADSRVW